MPWHWVDHVCVQIWLSYNFVKEVLKVFSLLHPPPWRQPLLSLLVCTKQYSNYVIIQYKIMTISLYLFSEQASFFIICKVVIIFSLNFGNSCSVSGVVGSCLALRKMEAHSTLSYILYVFVSFFYCYGPSCESEIVWIELSLWQRRQQ